MSAKIAIFTPSEAREKSCVNGARLKCGADRCMAWRWYETHLPDDSGDLVPNGETYGYCGLAGSPAPRRDASEA